MRALYPSYSMNMQHPIVLLHVSLLRTFRIYKGAEEFDRDIQAVMAQVAQRSTATPAGGAAAPNPAEPATPGSQRFRSLSPDTSDDDSATGGIAAAREKNPDASTGGSAAGGSSEKRPRVDGAMDVSSAGAIVAGKPTHSAKKKREPTTKEKNDKDPNMLKRRSSR